MTEAGLERSIGRLSVLKRFPSNPFALTAIVETLRELCATDDEADHLVSAALSAFDEWCSPLGLRKISTQIKAPPMYAPYREPDGPEESLAAIQEWWKKTDVEFKALAAARRAKGGL